MFAADACIYAAMDWNDLQIFLAVARAGQIARAASRIGIDATTVGRRVRRLERSLDQTLFEQTRSGQTLTEAGEQLLGEVETMERSALRLQGGSRTGEGVSGTIRISTSEGFGIWLVAEHLAEFTRSNPQLIVDLAASNGFLNPSRREADVAILLARPSSGMLRSRKLTEYALGLYGARKYLAEHAPLLSPEDLRKHLLIGYMADMLPAPELRYLDEILPGLAPRVRSSSINAQHRLAAGGAGIAVLPCFIGDGDARIVRILPEIAVTRSFWVVTHQDTSRLARVRAIVDWITGLVIRERSALLGASMR